MNFSFIMFRLLKYMSFVRIWLLLFLLVLSLLLFLVLSLLFSQFSLRYIFISTDHLHELLMRNLSCLLIWRTIKCIIILLIWIVQIIIMNICVFIELYGWSWRTVSVLYWWLLFFYYWVSLGIWHDIYTQRFLFIILICTLIYILFI